MKMDKVREFVEDLDDEEYAELNNYVAKNQGHGDDDFIYPMSDFDNIMQAFTPTEIAQLIDDGYFSIRYKYFCFNENGNLKTSTWLVNLGLGVETIVDYIMDNDDDCGYDEIRAILDGTDE